MRLTEKVCAADRDFTIYKIVSKFPAMMGGVEIVDRNPKAVGYSEYRPGSREAFLEKGRDGRVIRQLDKGEYVTYVPGKKVSWPFAYDTLEAARKQKGAGFNIATLQVKKGTRFYIGPNPWDDVGGVIVPETATVGYVFE